MTIIDRFHCTSLIKTLAFRGPDIYNVLLYVEHDESENQRERRLHGKQAT